MAAMQPLYFPKIGSGRGYLKGLSTLHLPSSPSSSSSSVRMPSFRNPINTAAHHHHHRVPPPPPFRYTIVDGVGVMDGNYEVRHHTNRYPSMRRAFNNRASQMSRPLQTSHINLISEMLDGVAIIDEAVNLSPPDMTYEGLLDLGERIGNAKSGLSKETISSSLKTRICSCARDGAKEAEICIICQDEYQNQEKIGSLRCGHEYHAGCIKQWLLLKNMCPICKRTAFS